MEHYKYFEKYGVERIDVLPLLFQGHSTLNLFIYTYTVSDHFTSGQGNKEESEPSNVEEQRESHSNSVVVTQGRPPHTKLHYRRGRYRRLYYKPSQKQES